MRVLLDATAVPANRGGVGRYIDALVPALVAEGVELVVVAQRRDGEWFGTHAPSAEVITVSPRLERRAVRLAWEQTGLPALIRSTQADVLHCPHYTMPVSVRTPVVVTLHDATFFSHPQLHSPVKARFFRTATRIAVRRASALVVPSRATRDEVLRLVGGDADAFHVAYHGVDPAVFHPVDETEKLRVSRSIGVDGRPYIAFLGTLEPRKNVPALIRAWQRAAEGRATPPALLLAGAPGWDADVDPTIAAVGQGLDVRRLGYLPLTDLAGFLAGAEVVAYPALGEGFGLPVLEAMACGAAVLTTRELSLPEVGGDAVEYTDVHDDAIEVALARLLDDADLRADLGARGAARAAEFTWSAAAQAHIDAYVRAVDAAER